MAGDTVERKEKMRKLEEDLLFPEKIIGQVNILKAIIFLSHLGLVVQRDHLPGDVLQAGVLGDYVMFE